MKRELTCTKEYIQSSYYANNEAPRQERDNQTSKFIHNIQTHLPKGTTKISQELVTQSKWWWMRECNDPSRIKENIGILACIW